MTTMNLQNVTVVATVLLSFNGVPLETLADSPGEVSIAGVDYVVDLENCQPRSALAKSARREKWRKISYQTESFSGTMLVAVEESDAPDVTYKLGRTGWHEVYLGIYRKPFEAPKRVLAKMSGDPAFTILSGRPGETDHQENWIDDIYFKTMNLEGQSITLRQVRLPAVEHAWVAYIKLVPLGPETSAAVLADRARFDTKRLFVHCDAHLMNETGSKDEIVKYFEPLRHSDVSRIYWEAGGGDRVLFFSEIAGNYETPLHAARPVVFPRQVDRVWAQTWQAYRRNGVDPLRVAAEFSHEMGVELHASYRVGGFVYPPPHDELYGDFFREHPDLVCRTRDGTPLPRISYAYPEVRRYVVSLFQEMARYPIDGVCVLYNRRPPLLGYEKPLVEGFQQLYGEDPRQLDEHDPRWLDYHGTVLTQFMRELRTALNEASQQADRPRRLEISAVVCRYEENRFHGMDLKTWVKEGLVDTIIPYSSSVRLNSYVPAWETADQIRPFLNLVEGTNCRLAPNLMPRGLSGSGYQELAQRLYALGIENLFFWDGLERVRKVLRLGHREEIVGRSRYPDDKIPAAMRLKKLGRWELTTETPG